MTYRTVDLATLCITLRTGFLHQRNVQRPRVKALCHLSKHHLAKHTSHNRLLTPHRRPHVAPAAKRPARRLIQQVPKRLLRLDAFSRLISHLLHKVKPTKPAHTHHAVRDATEHALNNLALALQATPHLLPTRKRHVHPSILHSTDRLAQRTSHLRAVTPPVDPPIKRRGARNEAHPRHCLRQQHALIRSCVHYVKPLAERHALGTMCEHSSRLTAGIALEAQASALLDPRVEGSCQLSI